MSKFRKAARIAVSLMMITMVFSVIEPVTGGRPIFSSNILAVHDIYERNQKVYDMEVDSSGRIYLVYTTDEMYYNDVYIVHSDNGGKTWSNSSRVDDVLRDGNESNDRSAQNFPRLAIASNDTVYVVWMDSREKAYFMEQPSHIRVAWSRDGENFSKSVKVTPNKEEPTWDAVRPDIAINSEGRIVLAWLDEKDSGAYKNVWSSFSIDGGSTWSEMTLVNDDGLFVRTHEYLRCVMHGDDVYVTWHDDREDDNQFRPYLSVSHDGGETFGPNKALSDDKEARNSRQWPSPAVDDAGNLYVTWRDKRTGNDEIWFTSSMDKGGNFTKNKRLTIAPDGSDDWFPCTDAAGDGIVGVVFQRSVPYKSTKDEGEIFYMNSSDGGETWDDLLRVDDTDRYYNDLSMQEKPIIRFDNGQRALSTWWDSRDYYARYIDVYFASHSGPVDGPNLRPQLFDLEFWSSFDFNTTVGSSDLNITFSCNYSDQNNDVPIEGYPRVHIFSDDSGGIPVLEEPITMEKIFPGDIDYMDGAEYKAWIKIPYQGRVWWRIEVVEEGSPIPFFSNIMEGPLIDATPPKITIIEPKNQTWLDSESVFCKVLVEDFEGGNVRPGSIKIRKSVSGIENLEKGVRLPSKKMIDNNTYEAWGNVILGQGESNYLQFEAFDKVGNGPGLSEILNIWVDPEPPFYTAQGPRELQIYEEVNCTVQWLDHLPNSNVPSSGLNLSSIEYSYRTTTEGFSEWARPDGIRDIGNGVFVCWVHLNFPDEGVYNSVKWRAADNLGAYDETPGLHIKVDVPENYPPVLDGKGYPKAVVSSTPHLFWDSAYDEEGDALFYKVMLLRYPGELQLTPWIPLGQRTFYDIPDHQSLIPGYYMVRINVTDNIGGYDTLDHIFRIMDQGTPPPSDVPEFGLVSVNPESNLIFKMDESELPPVEDWNSLVGSQLASRLWDNGGQVLEEAYLKMVPGGYLITYSDNASERGEEYFILDNGGETLSVFRADLMTWERSSSTSKSMRVEYMVRIGSRPYLGDVLEWTNVGTYPSLTRDLLNTSIGIYSIQIMATYGGNYSRVTQGTLKVNDHNVTYGIPEKFKSHRGKGMGFTIDLTNFATYMDNVTLVLEGTLAEDEQIYFEASGGTRGEFSLPSQKILTVPKATTISITVFPDSDYTRGKYNLSIKIISEDKHTIIHTENITIDVQERPSNSLAEEISDDLYSFLTDTFPFLKPIKQSLLVPLFLIFIVIIISLISILGISIYRKKFKKQREVDPYKEQRKVYKELYGTDPTEEQLRSMKAESAEDDGFFDDIPSIDSDINGPVKDKFDSGHIESEKPRGEKGSMKDLKDNSQESEE